MAPDSAVAPVVVRFPHRSRRGWLVGLSGPQLVVAGVALVGVMVALTAGGVAGAARLLPVWAVGAGAIWLRRAGRPLADWIPLLVRYAARAARGQLAWLARPAGRPVTEGLLHLPGAAASLRVVSASGPAQRRLAAVLDPHRRTLTAVVRVTGRAFALLDPAQQAQQVHGWGRTLAGLARGGHIRTIQVLERTVPDSGDALVRHFQHHRVAGAPLAGEVYADLVAAAGPAAAPHECYIAIALDLKAARRQVAQAGGGLAGAFTVLHQATDALNAAARQAEITLVGWLTAREVAAVIRTAYDPAAHAALHRWSPTATAQAEPSAAGPVVQIEEIDHLRTDTAVHATYWVQDWPRTDTHPGFLHGILFASGIRRTLSLLYRPAPVDAALRDVQRRKAAVIADASERARRGQVDSEAHSIEYADIQERERQLIAGHADLGLSGLLTVSAPDPAGLAAACAQIESAAITAGIDLRRLYLQQAAAFTTAALPLARTT
ncbi:SCO6880 family protein [Streptomyces sp. 4N509B]|uniref:SCO6880 family protein n=1 Tax=Streptomyces sp. 4N509B TaxID=3457413 RepID=UPI003FCFB7CD